MTRLGHRALPVAQVGRPPNPGPLPLGRALVAALSFAPSSVNPSRRVIPSPMSGDHRGPVPATPRGAGAALPRAGGAALPIKELAALDLPAHEPQIEQDGTVTCAALANIGSLGEPCFIACASGNSSSSVFHRGQQLPPRQESGALLGGSCARTVHRRQGLIRFSSESARGIAPRLQRGDADVARPPALAVRSAPPIRRGQAWRTAPVLVESWFAPRLILLGRRSPRGLRASPVLRT